MRDFIILWLGQIVSAIGSKLTSFAVAVWVWEETQSVTALTLIGVATQMPGVLMSLYAGLIVDRYSRKSLMILSDTVAAISTVILVILYGSGQLQLWHFYVSGAFSSCFGQLQNLAYASAIATIVPKQHYTRASSMGSFFHYGSVILAPALAGILYPLIGLGGIFGIDLFTFTVGIITLAAINVPPVPPHPNLPTKTLTQLTFGFRYLRKFPSLLALLGTTSLFWLFHDLGGAIFTPLILTRTDNNTQILGQIFAAAGVGGVLSATVISIYSGSKSKKIKGLLWGMIAVGICKTIFGFAVTPLIWIPAQFFSSLNFPLIKSTNTSIWMGTIPVEVQGRIFSVRFLMRQLVSLVAIAAAGPLTDYIFIPALSNQGVLNPLLGKIFGSEAGAGLAFFYVLCSLCMLLIGVGGYVLSQRHSVESSVTK